jgi:hypothetical protein
MVAVERRKLKGYLIGAGGALGLEGRGSRSNGME